jgi:hypothetical protein
MGERAVHRAGTAMGDTDQVRAGARGGREDRHYGPSFGLVQIGSEEGRRRYRVARTFPNPARPAMCISEAELRLSPSPDKGLDRGFMVVLYLGAPARHGDSTSAR